MMRFKFLRAIITAVLLIILCACSQPSYGPAPSESPGRTDSSSPTPAESNVDLTYLLTYIAESGKPLESFPALITGADAAQDGYVLHLDRLEYNPNFEPGDLGDETFFINESEKTENIDIAEIFCAVYAGGTVYDISPDLLNYISGCEGGAQFTVFTLDGKALFLSEITVP
jgi:hypothetical protein